MACKLEGQNSIDTPEKLMNSKDLGESTRVGTPFYLAPEIWSENGGECLYSTKSDMWALGVILYEICTKHKPFVADNMDSL